MRTYIVIIQRRLAAVDQLSKKITEDDLKDTSPDFAQFLIEAQGLLGNNKSSDGRIAPSSGTASPAGHLSQSSSASNMHTMEMDGIMIP